MTSKYIYTETSAGHSVTTTTTITTTTTNLMLPSKHDLKYVFTLKLVQDTASPPPPPPPPPSTTTPSLLHCSSRCCRFLHWRGQRDSSVPKRITYVIVDVLLMCISCAYWCRYHCVVYLAFVAGGLQNTTCFLACWPSWPTSARPPPY